MGQPSPPFEVGWHPDPAARYELRYFNGETWTADVSAAGRRFVDPYGTPGQTQGWAGNCRAWCSASSALTTGWMPFVFVFGAVCSVLGIIFGAIVLRRRGDPRGFALTGVITGLAGLVLVVARRGDAHAALTNALDDFVDEPPAIVDVQQLRQRRRTGEDRGNDREPR